jgi:hypothetical protein
MSKKLQRKYNCKVRSCGRVAPKRREKIERKTIIMMMMINTKADERNRRKNIMQKLDYEWNQ